MDCAPRVEFDKMLSAESFYMLSFLLDNLDGPALKALIDLVYPAHRSFRVVICQWLMSGHFSSAYYIETTNLAWSTEGEPDYEADLVYGVDEGDETKGPKRKRGESR